MYKMLFVMMDGPPFSMSNPTAANAGSRPAALRASVHSDPYPPLQSKEIRQNRSSVLELVHSKCMGWTV